MMLIKKLLDTCYLEYVIIFDDDQIHHNNWIETMVEKCEPLSILSWYGKVFKTCDYWNNIENTDQILTYGDMESGFQSFIASRQYQEDAEYKDRVANSDMI